MRPERSENVDLDGERKPLELLESPQSYDSGSRSLHPTDQGTPGVRIMRTIAPPSVIRPTIRIARPRLSYRSVVRTRTNPGLNVTRPNLRASTSEVVTSLRHVPAVPSNLAISSPYGPSDLSDEGQSETESPSPLGRP